MQWKGVVQSNYWIVDFSLPQCNASGFGLIKVYKPQDVFLIYSPLGIQKSRINFGHIQ